MKLIKAIIQPHMLDNVKAGLDEIGITGMTVREVSGSGRQKGYQAEYRGARYVIRLLPKVEIEIVAKDEDIQKIVDKIVACARTGSIGDGKVFVLPVESAIRIRTGEKDSEAL